MQTKLETKGISKRSADTLVNSSKTFGPTDDLVKGNSRAEGDEYDINGANAQKGGDSAGSLVNHLNSKFDLSTGGSKTDVAARNKQIQYAIPGVNSYSEGNIYSDADNILIDTSANEGQVVIY